jgi:hypothetical protein
MFVINYQNTSLHASQEQRKRAQWRVASISQLCAYTLRKVCTLRRSTPRRPREYNVARRSRSFFIFTFKIFKISKLYPKT